MNYDEFKKTYWQTADGRNILISELEDMHIANIIHWINSNDGYSYNLRENFYRLSDERKLHYQFINMAPFPFKQDGRWKTLRAGHSSYSVISG